MDAIEEAADQMLSTMGYDGRETFETDWLVTQSGLASATRARAIRHLEERGDVCVAWSPFGRGEAEAVTLLFPGRVRYQQIKHRFPEAALSTPSYRIFNFTEAANGGGQGRQTFPEVGDRVWVDETLATVTEIATFTVTPENAAPGTFHRRYLEVRVQMGLDEA